MSFDNEKSSNNNDEEEGAKLFYTTTDLMNTMNSALIKLETEQDVASPRFELQKRLPNGSTVKADENDMAVADMESKFKQAAGEVQDLPEDKKLEWAQLQRQEGNTLYVNKEYKEAIDVYLTCLVVKSDNPEFIEQVFLPVMNNLAQCTLQLGFYKKAQSFCTMALEEKELPDQPETIAKLYFRRGKARRLGGDYVGAEQDLMKAIELLPQNLDAEHRAIEKELQLAERSSTEGKRNEAKQKYAMKRFFDTTTSVVTPVVPGEPAPKLVHPKLGLYGTQKRKYSTLRARREDDDAQQHTDVKQLTYWQYYLAVIGSIAERLLILLGDEETIEKEQEQLRKEDWEGKTETFNKWMCARQNNKTAAFLGQDWNLQQGTILLLRGTILFILLGRPSRRRFVPWSKTETSNKGLL